MLEHLVRQVFVVDSEPVQTQAAQALDDRALRSLLDAMRSALPLDGPEWTQVNSPDPGVTLVQLFAYLTEVLMYQAPSRFDRHVKRLAFALLSGVEGRLARPVHVRFSPGQLLTDADLEALVDYVSDEVTPCPPTNRAAA